MNRRRQFSLAPPARLYRCPNEARAAAPHPTPYIVSPPVCALTAPLALPYLAVGAAPPWALYDLPPAARCAHVLFRAAPPLSHNPTALSICGRRPRPIFGSTLLVSMCLCHLFVSRVGNTTAAAEEYEAPFPILVPFFVRVAGCMHPAAIYTSLIHVARP